MTETEKRLMKCVESLYSVLAIVTVAVDDGRFRPSEGKAIERAFSAYNSSHYDLLHQKEGVSYD